MAVKEAIRANLIRSLSCKQRASKAVFNDNIDTTSILEVSKTVKNNSSKTGFISFYSS